MCYHFNEIMLKPVTFNEWKRMKIFNKIPYFSVAAFGWFVRRLPKRLAMRLGSMIGRLLYRALKRRRQIALENLRIAFGDTLSEREYQEICLQSFINVGKTGIEFLRFPKLTRGNIWQEVSVEGTEHLVQSLDAGRGAIVFLPHFGNWELLALVYGVIIPDQAKALAFPLKNRWLNELVWKYREHLSLKLIPRQQAVKETFRALKTNYAIGFFADQDAGREGVFVDFFGRPASAVRGPVTFALKTGAPLHFSLDIRQPDDRHHVHISPQITLERSDNFEQGVQTNTARLMDRLEEYIRQYPAQWLWMHNRWKTVPDSDWQTKRQQRDSVERR